MPLGVLSDEEFLKELEKNQPKKDLAKILDKPSEGRPAGKENTPDVIRKIIGEEKLEGASSAELAKLFNVGPQAPTTYASGATTTGEGYGRKDEGLKKHLSGVKERISRRAGNKLMRALDSITPEKLVKLEARDASSIAKDMSTIIRNMEPKDDGPLVNVNSNFVFYAPKLQQEEAYEVIDVVD